MSFKFMLISQTVKDFGQINAYSVCKFNKTVYRTLIHLITISSFKWMEIVFKKMLPVRLRCIVLVNEKHVHATININNQLHIFFF